MTEPHYHEGEIFVQRKAGQRDRADHSLRAVRDSIPAVAVSFLAQQRFLVVGAADHEGRMWATKLTGEPGFLHCPDDRTVEVRASTSEGDPLTDVLTGPTAIGALAIQPQTRRRMRLNGTTEPRDHGFRLTTEQVYANCPKYIQKRTPTVTPEPGRGRAKRGESLDEHQLRLVAAADTFFVATADREGHADASHRGGNPGFVDVLAPDRLRWPDYPGNAMFMTLGNLHVNPAVGLLFPDWETGTLVAVSGHARLDWGERLDVEVVITDVVELPGASPLRWSEPEPSRHNP